MISCLVTHVTRNQQGTAIAVESMVSGDTLDVGRGASCKIHLADHLVYLHHATIRRTDNGALYLQCEKSSEVVVNGALTHVVPLAAGTHIELGPYEIIVVPTTPEFDLAVSIELLENHRLDRARINEMHKRSPRTIASLGYSKRRISIALAAFILLLFLILPLLPKISSSLDTWQAKLPVTMTDALRPGELSEGHDVFGSKCSNCHRQAFTAIDNNTCLECHANIRSHFKGEAVRAKDSEKMGCTKCHVDHNGKFGLTLHSSTRCISCHANLKKQKPDTARSNVGNFKSAHPSFHVSLPAENEASDELRLLLKDKLEIREHNGLKFSHQAHLNPKGLSSREGKTVMVCESCHRSSPASKNFAPIKMQRDCQHSGCHEIFYRDPMFGLVPHGSVSKVESDVNQFLLFQYSNMGTLPQSDCADLKGNNVQRTLNCISRLSHNVLKSSVFRKNMGCGECHEISGHDSVDTPWEFAPVKINHKWFPRAKFSHSKHTVTPCDKCHDKSISKSSSDVSMPDIEKCRECHVGDKETNHKVASHCDSCHQFHGGLSYPEITGRKPSHVDPTKK